MRKRMFRGVEPRFALLTAAWTLADLGLFVDSIDPEKGTVESASLTVWVSRADPSWVLVEFGHPIDRLPRIVDPDFYESFFGPYSVKLGSMPELVELPPLKTDDP